jgi:hypothetical protein
MLPGTYVSATLNGVALPDGGRVALATGSYRLSVRVDVTGGKVLPTYVRFEPSDDQEAEIADWQAAQARCRATLKRTGDSGQLRKL